MEYITDITENVKEYIGSLGYGVLDSDLFLLNHNIETVPRMYHFVRPQAV